jgi:diguanylate cyclase (GGDEF)-like protein/PAS domain S-box-containing protein
MEDQSHVASVPHAADNVATTETATTEAATTEALRLATLYQYDVLDTPSEPEFDRVVELARTIFNTPIALVTLVDQERQWFKACYGLDIQQTDRNVAFCDYTIRTNGVMVVSDALEDNRFKHNPLVTGAPYIRFYAGVPLTMHNGSNIGSLCVIDSLPRSNFDVTAQQILVNLAAVVVDELELRLSTQRALEAQADTHKLSGELASFFELSPDLFCIVDGQGVFLQLNPAWEQSLGFTTEDLCGQPFWKLLHPDDRLISDTVLTELLKKNELTGFENRFRTQAGEYRWFCWSAKRDLATNQIYAVAHDVTDAHQTALALSELNDHLESLVAKRTEALEQANTKLYYDAVTDALTGLANRALFLERLEHVIDICKSHLSHKFAVLFLDLDRFKLINDGLGHTIGDAFLVAIAESLRSCVEPENVVARFGGDEFTILLEDVQDITEVVEVALCVQANVSAAFNVAAHVLHTTASIGIVFAGANYQTAEAVLRDADTAMYAAKAHGKACHVIFDETMRTKAVNLLSLENNLRYALVNDEFTVYYQPIVSLATSTVTGFEALVRWCHPDYGMISPGDFIPLAEETGLVIALDRWVLRQAVAQVARWRASYPELVVNVNLTSTQFEDSALPGELAALLAQHQLEPTALKLEITENTLMDSPDVSLAVLEQLHEHGIGLCVDDFGTGYSSLSYLLDFPVNTLKIDRVFTRQMLSNDASLELVKTIMTMAQNLHLTVVAEGVETPAQLAKLHALGCQQVQGYLFGKPQPAPEAARLLTTSFSKKYVDLKPS